MNPAHPIQLDMWCMLFNCLSIISTQLVIIHEAFIYTIKLICSSATLICKWQNSTEKIFRLVSFSVHRMNIFGITRMFSSWISIVVDGIWMKWNCSFLLGMFNVHIVHVRGSWYNKKCLWCQWKAIVTKSKMHFLNWNVIFRN